MTREETAAFGAPPAVAARPPALPGLTGLRAIAAYFVFFHHYNWKPPQRFLGEGHTGVLVFFVLSGFLITYRYRHAFEDVSRTGWKAPVLLDYAVSRIARIWPMYMLLAAVTLSLQGASTYGWFLNLTLLKGLSNPWKFTGIPQSWSLTVEEMFYASAPLLFAWLGRAGPGRAARWRVLGSATLLAYAAGAALVILGRAVPLHAFETWRFVAVFTFFGRAFEFACGAAAALWLRDARPRGWGTYGSLLLFIALLLAVSVFTRVEGEVLRHPMGIVLNNLILPPVAAWFILSLATERTWIQRVLDWRVSRVLGASSYTFYLLHYGLLGSLLASILPVQNRWTSFLWLNLLSLGLWAAVEDPLHRAIKRRFARATGR